MLRSKISIIYFCVLHVYRDYRHVNTDVSFLHMEVGTKFDTLSTFDFHAPFINVLSYLLYACANCISTARDSIYGTAETVPDFLETKKRTRRSKTAYRDRLGHGRQQAWARGVIAPPWSGNVVKCFCAL